MRQIFLDTETTGLLPEQGHRIIEIAAVEVINRRLTGNKFHVFLNPEREIDPEALKIHGITSEFLQDKSFFGDVADELLDFVANSELVMHNAPFDVGFLNHELGQISRKPIEEACASIIDTLKMAKELRPGQRNNLNALCSHYGIDNSKRTLHGALPDAELLAEVYLAMTRGQDSLMMDMLAEPPQVSDDGQPVVRSQPLPVIQADAEELAAHQQYLDGLTNSGGCLWTRLENDKQS